jgi:hypothetical protein
LRFDLEPGIRRLYPGGPSKPAARVMLVGRNRFFAPIRRETWSRSEVY